MSLLSSGQAGGTDKKGPSMREMLRDLDADDDLKTHRVSRADKYRSSPLCSRRIPPVKVLAV